MISKNKYREQIRGLQLRNLIPVKDWLGRNDACGLAVVKSWRSGDERASVDAACLANVG